MRNQQAQVRCCRVAVALAAHFCTAAWWPGYGRLPARQRLAWTNRISSALHVSVPASSRSRAAPSTPLQGCTGGWDRLPLILLGRHAVCVACMQSVTPRESSREQEGHALLDQATSVAETNVER